MTELTSSDRRKYALSIRRIDHGVWGYLPHLFYEVTLTTRESDMLPGIKGLKRTASKFGKDNQRLMKWVESLGFKVGYCGCFEFSPGKGLLHWHGLWRVKGGFLKLYEGPVRDNQDYWYDEDGKKHTAHIDGNTRALGDKWNQYHNAFAVSLEQAEKNDRLAKYIEKHIVKNYLNEKHLRNKFLVSKGWCRSGVKEFTDEFKRWWVNGAGTGTWMSDVGYKKLNECLKFWCDYKEVQLNTDFGYFIAQGLFIYSEIYGMEELIKGD